MDSTFEIVKQITPCSCSSPKKRKLDKVLPKDVKQLSWREKEKQKEKALFEKQIASFDPEMKDFIRKKFDLLSKKYYDPNDSRISLIDSVH
jgi:hypothetical protein